MWQRAGDLYSQLPSVRNLWPQPAAPVAAAAAQDAEGDSSAASFDTADQGAPSLRVQSPQGRVYAPSVPSSVAASSARVGRAPIVGAVVQDSARPALVTTAAPSDATAQARAGRASARAPSSPAARPVVVKPPPSTEPSPAPAPPPTLTAAVGQPMLAGGLVERLKAQRAARAEPVASADPSTSPPSLTTNPLARGTPTRQPPGPPAPPHSARPAPTRAATIHPSPPLQPFHSPPRSNDRSPYPPDSASADPTSFGLPADLYPPHNVADDYGADETHSPRPWHDGFSYVGPAGAALRTPSRSSGRTELHEAHGRASPLDVAEAHEAQRHAARPSRAELLEWERARREAERGEAHARDGVRQPFEREEEDVRSSWGWEEATEGLRDPARSVEEKKDEEVRVDEMLMQDWLLQPPSDRPVTDGLLSFPDMWHAVYAVLTPSHLYLLADADANADALIAFAVADVVAIERISKHARAGFEPFRVELRGGDSCYFAGAQKLDAELWSLKIKNAQSGAYRRSSTLMDDLELGLSSVPSSSSTRPRRHASSPPISLSAHGPPPSFTPHLASPPRHDQKDPHWMRTFHTDVHARPVLVEELPPHAPPDDWGRISPPSRSAWPARPPTEVYSPPSPPSTVRLEAQHALELGVMRDRLELVRAVLTGQQEGLESDAARAREAAQELEGLKERLVQQATREGGGLSDDEERVFEKITWLEHLNGLRRRTSAEQDELARVVEEEARLADELRRELEALGAASGGAGYSRHYSTSGQGAAEERGGQPQTRDYEHRQHVPRAPVDNGAPPRPVHPVDLPSKFSSNSSAPRRYRTSPRDHRPTLSPVVHGAVFPDAHDPHQQQYPSEQGSISREGDDDEERRYAQRRRLQELFLEVEERMLNQKKDLAASEDKNRQLTHTLGKVVKLVGNTSSTHSSQLSALLDRLDKLMVQLHPPTHLAVPPSTLAPSSSSSSASRSTPTPPPPYHPTSPLVRLGHAPTARPSHGPRGPRPVTAESLALVPGDGRMAPRALPRRAAEALVGGTTGGAAAAGRPRLRAGGPVYGVDAALPQHAHDPRWAAGAVAARRARELDAQQRQLDVPAPPARPARLGAATGNKGGDALEREAAKPRVDGALHELRRGVGREGHPAKAALAVWEPLGQTRRARTEREQGKKAGKRTEREKKRGGGGFRLGGTKGRAL